MTLISPDNDLALMAVLFVIAGVAFLAERTRIGSHLTGAVIAILSAIAIANLRIIPHSAPAFDFVFSYFVPVLIPLFLFKADLRHMLFETTRMTGAFLIASAGTVIGVIIAVSLLDLGNLATAADIEPALREAAIAGLFTSTYIGGSVNYAALGEITGLSTDASFFSAATATDNLFSAVFLGVIAMLPGWNWLASRFSQHDHGEEQAVAAGTEPITAMSLTLAMATAISFVAIGDFITSQPALRRHYDPGRDGGNGVPGADEAPARRVRAWRRVRIRVLRSHCCRRQPHGDDPDRTVTDRARAYFAERASRRPARRGPALPPDLAGTRDRLECGRARCDDGTGAGGSERLARSRYARRARRRARLRAWHPYRHRRVPCLWPDVRLGI
jgi:hypothetical protein